MLNDITILKASGQRESFSVEKLRNSLLRSGASLEITANIIASVKTQLYSGISTTEIYDTAFKLLRKLKKGTAARYKLKAAIMELGPTGFPFEQFVARIFQHLGYTTQTGQIMSGKCVTHEVDVIAKNETEQLMMECKFHQKKGTSCDVKVPLYISARFNDIQQEIAQKGNSDLSFQGWVVTNTHFTKDAVAFGICAGLHLLGWDFPEKKNLRSLIDEYNLHPITCLTSISGLEKQKLLEKNIVLCSELKEHPDLSGTLIPADRLRKAKEECTHLSMDKKSGSGN